MIIRKAGLEDAPIIAEILTQAMRYKLTHNDTAWGSSPSDRYTEDEVKIPIKKGYTYLVSQGNEAVGTFQLIWEDEMMWGPQKPEAGYIHQIGLSNSSHGQGVGRYIIAAVEEMVSQNGRECLRLDCPPANISLRNYYESLGFIHVKDREIIISATGYRYIASLYQKAIKQKTPLSGRSSRELKTK